MAKFNRSIDERKRHERSHGDKFVQWYNFHKKTNFSFQRHGDPTPDLIYREGPAELLIEVTTAYYDEQYAKWLWSTARFGAESDANWFGVEPDECLAAAVLQSIVRKSEKNYPENCTLLIAVPPGVTSEIELEKLLKGQIIPPHRFSQVYVAGIFPEVGGIGGGFHTIDLTAIEFTGSGTAL